MLIVLESACCGREAREHDERRRTMPRFCQIIRGSAMAPTRRTQRALRTLLASTLLLALAAGPVSAQTFTFTAVLTSGQEPPPNTNDSKALGVAFVTFNTDTGEVCFSISYDEDNLTSEETNAHFHAPAPPGVNAGVIIQLPTPGSPKNGCVTPDLTEALRRDLFRGLWYINIHTAKNTGGEIRGQLLPQAAPVY
jgi:CHRD domain